MLYIVCTNEILEMWEETEFNVQFCKNILISLPEDMQSFLMSEEF